MTLKNVKNIHFMGIGGSGMKSVAGLAKENGFKVTGCDIQNRGHDKSHLEGVDLLVISPAVIYQSSKHPEYLGAKKKGIVMTWQEFLGKCLMKGKKVIAVSGTHGKTTTTAMVASLLIDNGFNPTVVLGARPKGWKDCFRFGEGEWFVVEADEFNNNFLNYHPEIIIINNIEFDHPDFFKNEAEVKKSFEKFKRNLVGKKILITGKDSENRIFNLKVFGKHNQDNANMVFVLGKKLGLDDKEIFSSLENFEGIERRLEFLGKTKFGVQVFDDYAHHPTAIKTTLEGLREKYPNKKILAIIEPHGYKRTRVLLEKYRGVFESVDEVVVGPIFRARDKVDKSINSEGIAKISGHKKVSFAETEEDLIKISKLKIKNCDIVVIMGAGRSNLWAKDMLSA